MKTRFVNYSGQQEWQLHQLLPYGLEADTVVFLPDVNPGKAPLPTGCVVRTNQADWRQFALSDVGCGMLLLKSQRSVEWFRQNKEKWDLVAHRLRNHTDGAGHLGSGNHFLDALASATGDLYFLIHTGSRLESDKVNEYVSRPTEFDHVFADIVFWAEQNRLAIMNVLEHIYGQCDIVVHNNHNHYEFTPEGVIIRKGAVRLLPGELSVLPSHMTGETALVRGKPALKETLYSISHGTGRTMSRSDAKMASKGYDFSLLRRQIDIPVSISDDSIKTDAPYCYRDIDAVMQLLDDLVEEMERFTPLGYIGHL